MSSSRNSVSENQASASENESDRHALVGKQRGVSSQNKPLQTNQLSEDSHSPNQKKHLSALSVSTSHLYNTEGSFEDVSSSDGITIRNTSSASSDKDSGMCKESEERNTQSSTPSVVLNSASSSVSSLNNSTNLKDDLFDNQSQTDGVCSMSPGATSQESSLFPDNLSRSSESGKSVDLGLQKTPEGHTSKGDVREKVRSSEKKEKKKSSWYNMLNPSYKSKSDDFKRLFKDLPDSERLIVDYSCALQKDILVQGRLYVSQNYICFYANIFRWETFLVIRCHDITSITKEKTARVIPNAIQITTASAEKHFFTSFGTRDKTFLMLFRIWQNALLDQPMTSQELWQWVHFSYGEELGLTSDDDDYVAPSLIEDDFKSKHSDQSIKYIEKSYDKGDLNYQESASDVLIEEENSEPAVVNGNDDLPSLESIDEKEMLVKTPSENKSVSNQKSSEFPTDMSDTTESDENVQEVEFKCPCTSHEGKEVLNRVFPMSVDQVFSLIFTGSKFYYDLLESRKTYDIMESPWQMCPEFDLKMRQVSYTVTLNHAMAKSAQTTETQRLLKHSKPGQCYTIDCDVVNTGIPYSDAFTVKSVYCLTSVSKRECRLRISGCVKYKKTVWGIVKSLIEKSTMQGLEGFATDLSNALEKEAEMSSSQQGLAKKPRRRKRIKFDAIKNDTLKDTPRILQRQPTIRNIGPSISGIDLASLGTTPDIVIRVILITLVILLFLNMLLFYKLWSLEDQSAKQVPPTSWDYPDSQSTLTKEDYIHLLQKQDALHRAETERWREALSEVIKLIHLIEKSLTELKSSIDTYSSTSVLKVLALHMTQNSDSDASAETSSNSQSEA